MGSRPLGWTTELVAGTALVAVHGRLDVAGTPLMHAVLLKCLAEQPDALLIDLSELELVDPMALSVVTAVARQAARWPGTPLLLCGPTPEVNALVERGRYGRIPVHASVDQARRAVADGRVVVATLGDELLPISGAVRHARDLATEACASWDLTHLIGPASLVVSELVSNAAEHAGTMITVSFARRARHLHIAVRDGSDRPPVKSDSPGLDLRGRGLVLVDTVAQHWGWLPSRDGKVVWATLAA
ncbi:ATP-binding protein [Paractinoplanes ferrugineus]|uniref:ATP-binding protein n=1 Tax=Paractinoplanes ferrugineus TaxID=113564 RepID=A0A919IWX1_9ACTN|nr:STAS domain-containing protein [Actinoplanes ferrugineus]GIE10571.1 ATP-binding protein [Actinoplanes ferrugineus]